MTIIPYEKKIDNGNNPTESNIVQYYNDKEKDNDDNLILNNVDSGNNPNEK